MLTGKQVKGLRAYLEQRQAVFQRAAAEDEKVVDVLGAPMGGSFSARALRARGKASGLSIALAAIKAIEEEGAEPWLDADQEIERHGAT